MLWVKNHFKSNVSDLTTFEAMHWLYLVQEIVTLHNQRCPSLFQRQQEQFFNCIVNICKFFFFNMIDFLKQKWHWLKVKQFYFFIVS